MAKNKLIILLYMRRAGSKAPALSLSFSFSNQASSLYTEYNVSGMTISSLIDNFFISIFYDYFFRWSQRTHTANMTFHMSEK